MGHLNEAEEALPGSREQVKELLRSQAAVTDTHRLKWLLTTHLFFSQFWRLKAKVKMLTPVSEAYPVGLEKLLSR